MSDRGLDRRSFLASGAAGAGALMASSPSVASHRRPRPSGRPNILLAELEADGLAEDTIVFYFSDNGGVLPWSKRHANEHGLRVPLIVYFPQKWRHLAPARPGSVVEEPVNFVDFPPTATTLAGLQPPDYMQGEVLFGARRRRRRDGRRYAYGQRSRLPERYDLQRTVRDERYIYIRHYMPHRRCLQHNGYPWQMKSYQVLEQKHLDADLTLEQERLFDERPSEQLYDVWLDRDLVRNLVDSARHRDELRRLRRALGEHMLETNDNGFIPEASPLKGYEQSRAPGAYPLRRVMRVADTAIERDPENLDAFVEWLGDPNEVIRYWAAMGILMLKDAGQPALAALNAAFDEDPSIQVRIVAAEALALLGHSGRSGAFLAQTADAHENTWARLQAFNALTYIGVPAARYLPMIQRWTSSPDEYIGNASRYLYYQLTGTYTPASQIYIGP